ARLGTQGGVLRQAAVDLLDLVHAEARGDVEHDLRAHRLRTRAIAGLGDAARPHLPKREPERVHVVFRTGTSRAQALGRHVVGRAAVRGRTGATRAEAR